MISKKHFKSKKTIVNTLKKIATKKRGRCLSALSPSLDLKSVLKWECEKRHTWKAGHREILNGKWCPECTKVKKSEDKLFELNKIAKKRGGRCLSLKYSNKYKKLLWECKHGHQWYALPIRIQYYHTWCPECAKVKKTEDKLHELKKIAQKRGGHCRSNFYVNDMTKLLWECKEGHKWEARPAGIKYQGSWCPECARKTKITIAEMHELAAKRGGKCLSDVYVNTTTKLQWECSDGHQWKATPASIKQGSWCPECAKKPKYKIADMDKHAKTNGYGSLSDLYINDKTKLQWECGEGHQWETSLGEIQQEHWCPYCARPIKIYDLTHEINKALLLKYFNENANSGKKMKDFRKIFPSLSRAQILALLKELKSEGKVYMRGTTSAALWHLKSKRNTRK